MTIDGEMYLEHEEQHRVFLKPFEQNSFDGEWTTRSLGKVTDFNLILAEGSRGELQHIHLEKGDCYKIKSNPCQDEFRQVSEAFYCIGGTSNLIIDNNESLYLNKGDLALITRRNSESITLKLNNQNELKADVIRTIILYG